MTAYSVIGQSVTRAEGPAKVSGSALYTADVQPPGMLWGKILRSPYPHARIVTIDTTAAHALPGVHAVVTGADLPDRRVGRLRILASPSTCFQFAPGSERFTLDDAEPGWRWLTLHADGAIETRVGRLPSRPAPSDAGSNHA